MPELPEVEHLRRSLLPRLVGRTVASATLHLRQVAVGPDDPPGGFARQRHARARPGRLHARDLLAGATLTTIERRGKMLAVRTIDGRTLGVHLGMTGQLLWAPRGHRLPTDHVHARWRLDDGSRLLFRDPRRFGGLWLARTLEDLVPWHRLGPDALDLPPGRWHRALTGTSRPIKAALLDQRRLAGLGNIYADEALHRAGLHPMLPTGLLTPQQALALGRAARAVLRRAIDQGGSTLRDYRAADGSPGRFQHQHRVYGRAGQACLRCGWPLASGRVAQRTTVWCPMCQPLPDQPRARSASPRPATTRRPTAPTRPRA